MDGIHPALQRSPGLLPQFRNQFYGHPAVAAKVPEDVFLNAYLQASEVAGRRILREVELFRARTNLNIAAYLVRLGQGDSENLWRVIVEAEKALVHFNARRRLPARSAAGPSGFSAGAGRQSTATCGAR